MISFQGCRTAAIFFSVSSLPLPFPYTFKDDLLYYHDGQRSLGFDDHSL